MDVMTVSLDHLREVQKYLEDVIGDLNGPPVLNAMKESTLLLERRVKLNMQRDWHDTGRSMASVTPEVKMQSRVLTGIVGSNVTYVPYGEYGTGVYADPEESFAGAYLAGPVVGGRKGGIKPRKMFRKAFEASKTYIENLFDRTITMLVERK